MQQQLQLQAKRGPSAVAEAARKPSATETIGAAAAANPTVQEQVYRQFVGNIMKQGKRGVAERTMHAALLHVQQTFLLQPIAATTLGLAEGTVISPRQLLVHAVDAVAPVVRVKSSKRGSKNILTPTPMTDLQRRRQGILWIVDSTRSAGSRRAAASAGGKRLTFGQRLGQELIAIVRGESGSISKRVQLHKQALSNRSNLILADRKRRF
jgi:small subunit ribosomal protein S7